MVERLEQGKVAGWFQGRFEWGPRALGHRSILADPRRPEMKDLVNVKIKYREPFRPFAPSVLVGRAEEYFALSDAARHYPARFMLYVVDVHDAKRDAIPAVTHVDGTARLQTVREDTAPRYHRLIERFGKATGVPVLLNTSFNLKGEPIVNTPAEALATFGRSGMDVLVLGDYGRREAHVGRVGAVKLSEHLQSRAGILGELLQFFWERKWWWLTPMLLLLLLVGGLIVFAQSSAIAPFIYTLF